MRIIVDDYDARLSPVTGSTGGGKVERKLYQEGDSKLSIKIEGVDLPDGSRIDVVIGGGIAASVALRNGKAKLKLETRSGDIVPEVQAGDQVWLEHDGARILSGTFVPD